jgi:hypothetical protein
MATATKVLLSGATNGRAIKVAATSSPGTTIHTTNSNTTDFDEIWLYCYNSDTVGRELVIQWGGTSSPDDDIKVTIPPKQGLYRVVAGEVLQNGTIVKAYCATTNVLTISGYVNRWVN